MSERYSQELNLHDLRVRWEATNSADNREGFVFSTVVDQPSERYVNFVYTAEKKNY